MYDQSDMMNEWPFQLRQRVVGHQGMIGSVGRSSRKPGSVVWTLFSRSCRYSVNLAMINSLFVIRTPSILLTGYKEMF